MSGLESWLEAAHDVWQKLQRKASRLAPSPIAAEDLDARDPVTRWRAARALIGRPREEFIPRLIAMAGDDDALVRAAAVDALASWGPDLVLASVRTALVQSPTPAAAASLLHLLARLPDPANRAAIQPWLEHDDPEVRAAAFMALAALCDDADLPALIQALKTEPRPVQRAILSTLCAPGATRLAQRAAQSHDPVLSQRGQQALARIQRQASHQAQAHQRPTSPNPS